MKTHETLAQQEFVARQLRRRQMVVLARLFLFLSVLVLWEACARTGVINAFIFSSPSRIVRCFFSMVLDGSTFFTHRSHHPGDSGEFFLCNCGGDPWGRGPLVQ